MQNSLTGKSVIGQEHEGKKKKLSFSIYKNISTFKMFNMDKRVIQSLPHPHLWMPSSAV